MPSPALHCAALPSPRPTHAVTQMAVKNVKMLNLAHDWLQHYLPHVLSKINRVSFGIMNKEDYERAMADTPHMPLSRVKLAIPFEGKDVPSRASEFAHPDTIIGLSVLAYGVPSKPSEHHPQPYPVPFRPL